MPKIHGSLADDRGAPALIDPAVRPDDGWQERAQLLRIWDMFSTIAHGLDTWGAAGIVRALIAPFRRVHRSRSPAQEEP